MFLVPWRFHYLDKTEPSFLNSGHDKMEQHFILVHCYNEVTNYFSSFYLNNVFT
jgi:hypothetical protein